MWGRIGMLFPNADWMVDLQDACALEGFTASVQKNEALAALE